ncbi:MAG: hypothetical protein U0795_04585 [Pirellulales bacterium]
MKKLCGLFCLLALVAVVGCKPASEPAPKKAGDAKAETKTNTNTTSVELIRAGAVA